MITSGYIAIALWGVTFVVGVAMTYFSFRCCERADEERRKRINLNGLFFDDEMDNLKKAEQAKKEQDNRSWK